MNFLKKWIINLVVILILSNYEFLVHMESPVTIVALSIVVTAFQMLFSFLATFLMLTGCLTAGLGFVFGLALRILAQPLAFYYGQKYVEGFSVETFPKAVLFTLILTVVQSVFEKKTSSSS